MPIDVIRNNLGEEDIGVFLKLYILLYADDTVVLSESPVELQNALNGMYDYCKKWKMTVNANKTKVVIFSRGKVRRYPDFMFGSVKLEVTGDYIYLGIVFNYNGHFKKAIAKQTIQARRAMFALLRKALTLQLPLDLTCDLFDKLVLPVLLYGSEIWGFENLAQIEIFYRKFLRRVLKVHKSTPNCMLYGETGKMCLDTIVMDRMINFWCRILSGNQQKLVYKIYQLLFTLHEDPINNFKSKWITKIKSILDNSGYSMYWLDQTNINKGNVNVIKLNVIQRLQDMTKQNWVNEVYTNSVCTIYRIIQTKHDTPPYISKLNSTYREIICKFKCRNHKLPCNADRFNINYDAGKTCNLCDHNTKGDEFHYLFQCDYFQNDRVRLLNKYYYVRPNTNKMSELFMCGSTVKLAKLAIFCKLIMSTF